MILEVIVSSFFSGLGSTVFRELMNQANKKDERILRAQIRHELEAFAPSIAITVDDGVINEIVRRLKQGEISAYPGSPGWRNDTATYKIVSVLSEKVLDVWGGKTEDGVEIRQYRYHGGANQLWQLIPATRNGDTFKIVSELSGKVLDVWGGKTEDGVEIRQYRYHGGANQLWRLLPISQDDDTFKIVSELSGKVLDVWGGKTEDGVEIRQYSYHGGMNQRWRLMRVK